MTPLLRILSSVCASAGKGAASAKAAAATNSLSMLHSLRGFPAILAACMRGRFAERRGDRIEQQPVVERLAQVGGRAGGEALLARLGQVVRGDDHHAGA